MPPTGAGRLLAHAYPWDVLGDDAFVERALALGLDAVALAAAYHSTRAVTPLHPAHQLVEAPHAALYRPVREEAWAGAPLRPVAGRVPDGTADAFAQAAGRLRAAGLEVDAWTVLAHSTRLGTLHPHLAVVNCFGDRYSYAPCPSAAQVRDHCARLAAEAVRGAPVTGVSLEALGTMGVTHNAAHEKTAGAFGPALERVLSVCCCPRCRQGWAQRGADPEEVVAALRRAVRELRGADPADAREVAELLGERTAATVLAVRHAAADALRAQVLAALAQAAPAPLRVAVHTAADPWATGANPGASPAALADPALDVLVLQAWTPGAGTRAAVSSVRAAARAGARVGAYVTVLGGPGERELAAHVADVRAAGAGELHLYHLGLADRRGHELLAAAARTWRAGA
ncbi:hypothetical protein [Kineococcus indalonis]|uniref:hypothetical protein n=1 Tax=Kineococcus indalonis TaxID=2696566 RepID=UPI00141230C2|nr:hypothetical protein [Kineococcus indalonis]NAZ88208.1 hypothetical protein [Kineococcus indalonis]